MATPQTTTRFLSAYKILFPEKKLATFGFDEQPWYNYVAKTQDFFGRKMEIPIQYSPGGGGGSHTFEDAQASKGSALYTHFEITRKRSYKIISLDAEALEASENDKGAYLEMKKLETEAALKGIVAQTGTDAQGDEVGFVATVLTVPSSTTFTVADVDLPHFELEMRMQSSAGTPHTALRPGTLGYMWISGINTGTNTITVDATKGDSTTVLGLTAADKLTPKGNFNAALAGTEAWIPTVRTGLSTAFKGVTRSLYDHRLAGFYFDGSAYGLAECYERAFAKARLLHCNPETAWVNYNRFTDLSLELQGKVVREPVKLGEFAYDSIAMNCAGRKLRFMSDPNMQDTSSLCSTKSGWGFKSLYAAPRFLTKDTPAGTMLVEPTADGFEIRIGWRAEQFCRNPGEQMRILLPT